MKKNGWAIIVICAAGWVGQSVAASLTAAPSFYQADLTFKTKGKAEACPEIQVFSGDMLFPSKYEGDDSSRDDVNPEAMKEYEDKSKMMRDLQQLSAKVSDKIFKGNGTEGDWQCLLTHWRAWAKANALLGIESNHVGNSVRKWTLAAVSTSYLKIALNMPDALSNDDRQLMAHWFTGLAEQVRKDYYGRGPEKANNHDYWAAWSVMVASVILQRDDLFDWSYGVFKQAMTQITPDGYLPNELRRQTRALAYHTFALLPLSTMATFITANHKDALTLQHGAFAKLVSVVLANVNDSAPMAAKAGHPQIKQSLKEGGRLAWLAPYESLTHDPALLPLIKDTMPLKSSMLGGDQTWLYLRDQTELYPSK